MHARHSLIGELESAFQSRSQERRVETLRRVTDLFLANSERFTDEQVKMFDEVLLHLIKRIETKALIELSERLAPIENAPNDVMQSLARHEQISVARPVLTLSKRLTPDDLIEIVRTRSQAHALAITERAQIEESVTDVLLERADQEITRKVASNVGARFSESGFVTLVQRAEMDESLAEKLGQRVDIPLRLFRQLLLRATDTVLARLATVVNPERQDEVRQVLTAVSREVGREVASMPDFATADRRVSLMKQKGELGEAALLEFAKAGHYAETVVSIAKLCSVPVELIDNLFHAGRHDAVLIPCRAAELQWPTVRSVLEKGLTGRQISERELEHAMADYRNLSKASAEKVLRFWQVRRNTANPLADHR